LRFDRSGHAENSPFAFHWRGCRAGVALPVRAAIAAQGRNQMNIHSFGITSWSRMWRVVAAAAAFALSGCAPMDFKPTAIVEHNVSVAVYPIAQLPPATYTCKQGGAFWLCVSEDPIDVDLSTGTDYQINWVLFNADWAFDNNKGIDIKPMRDWRIVKKEPRQWSAQNKKEGGKGYKYSISVVKDGVPLNWDPSIMN
jgi:hypothetical protein